MYKCVVSNKFGEINANLSLNIEIAPVIRERPIIKKVEKKKSVVLQCAVQGQQDIQVRTYSISFLSCSLSFFHFLLSVVHFFLFVLYIDNKAFRLLQYAPFLFLFLTLCLSLSFFMFLSFIVISFFSLQSLSVAVNFAFRLTLLCLCFFI